MRKRVRWEGERKRVRWEGEEGERWEGEEEGEVGR